jgi:Na+-transporting NADH:ubiquinone oxidoreductase subunit C
MNSTNKVIGFTLIMTVFVAVLLTGLREVTKEKAALNEEIFNKRAILMAIEKHLPDGKKVKDLTDSDVAGIFASNIEQVGLNMAGEPVDGVLAEDIDMAKERKKPEADRLLPLYVYTQGDQKFYIISIRGNGLWDEIWGNIALEGDLATITGAAFDHKGETPGLGAEIKDNPGFSAQFAGKSIYDDQGNYTSVTVRKGGAKDLKHDVDGISGATVTGDGVTEMLQRGIKYYEPYFAKLKSNI